MTSDRQVSLDGDEIDPEDLGWNDARKRPVVVEATPMPAPFTVETPEGTMQGDEGDVLIRGVDGELYPCDSSIFAETYDLVPVDGGDMTTYPHSEPCDHTSPGGQCKRTPTAYVGEIYYACEEHFEEMREWVNDE